MSQPTAGERAFANRLRLDAAAVARARVVFNTIAFLPWPEPERVSLLSRLAREAQADVGSVLGKLALQAAPLTSFDELIPIDGLADKRVAGLARALADVDPQTFSPEGFGIAEVWERMAGLLAENAALRDQLDRLYAEGTGTGTGSTPALPVMLVREVASNIAAQTEEAAAVLREAGRGLQLANLELHLDCAAAAVNDEIALNLASPGGGSALRLSFAPGAGTDGTPDVVVPDVVGYTVALARRKLNERGLAFVVSALAGGEGVIDSQKPGAGDVVSRGSVIRLLVR